ncbi:MAG: anti-sigma factor family protein [Frankiaceae bacterium]
MDPTSEPRGSSAHAGLDRLARYDEGLLDQPDRDELDRHLASCPSCIAALAQVRSVRSALAGLPGPAMPPDVAERLRAAVAQEITARPAAAAPVGAAPAATVTALRPAGHRRSWLPTTAALGSIAAVIAAIAFVVVRGGDGGEGGSSAAGGPARVPAASQPLTHHTGRNYTIDSLRAAVPALLSEDGTRLGGSDQAPDTALSNGFSRLSSRSALVDCASHLGESYRNLLAVDYARFGGRPSLVLVFPDRDDAQRVEIFVVGPDCATNPNPIPQIVFASR